MAHGRSRPPLFAALWPAGHPPSVTHPVPRSGHAIRTERRVKLELLWFSFGASLD